LPWQDQALYPAIERGPDLAAPWRVDEQHRQRSPAPVSESLPCLVQTLLVFRNQQTFSFCHDAMPLLLQALPDLGYAAGVLGIHLAPRLQRSPVRRDVGFTFGSRFFRGVRGDPGEDAGGDGAADGGAVFPGDEGA